MGTIFLVHRLFGGMILPLLLLGAAIWFTVSWKPERWPGRPARIFHILVDVQFLLGLSYWIYLIVRGIGLVAHTAAVFGVGRWLGKDWEERKISKILEQEE
jgi:hypothetical protein